MSCCDPARNDTYDAMYNLYVKGSLSIETICELLELDKLEVVQALEKELDDDTLNEVMRSVYSKVGKQLGESSGVAEKIAAQLELDFTKSDEPRGIGLADPVPPIMVKCPACHGAGWTVLFVVRRDCKFCEGEGQVDAGKWLEYDEEKDEK